MTRDMSVALGEDAVCSLVESKQSLITTNSLEDTYTVIAREAAALVECDVVYVLDYMPRLASFRIVSAWPPDIYHLGTDIEADEGLIGFAEQSGRDLLLTESYADSPYQGRNLTEYGPVASILLRGADNAVIGGLTVARYTGCKPFSEENALTLSLFSSLAALALDRAQLQKTVLELEVENERQSTESAKLLASAQHELYQKTKELRALSGQADQITSAERMRISQSLHDGVKQNVAGVIRTLEAAERTMPEDAEISRAHVGKAIEFLRQIDADVRATINDLRPQQLDSSGLYSSLERYCQNFTYQTRIECDCRCNGEPRPLPEEVERGLYYVASETLQNVAVHSGASKVLVLLNYTSNAIRMSVEDDGKGFDVGNSQQQDTRRGLGLPGIKQRVEELGGFVTVDSAKGKGTRIYLRIPLY